MDHSTEPVPASGPEAIPPGTLGQTEPRAGRREWFLSIGSMVLAFLASQHHTVMMLVLAFGLGNAAAGPMTAAPMIRRIMVVMSLVMVGVIGYRMCRPGRPRSVRITGAISIVVTVGLAVWTIARFGF